jgi:hypothetical protein
VNAVTTRTDTQDTCGRAAGAEGSVSQSKEPEAEVRVGTAQNNGAEAEIAGAKSSSVVVEQESAGAGMHNHYIDAGNVHEARTNLSSKPSNVEYVNAHEQPGKHAHMHCANPNCNRTCNSIVRVNPVKPDCQTAGTIVSVYQGKMLCKVCRGRLFKNGSPDLGRRKERDGSVAVCANGNCTSPSKQAFFINADYCVRGRDWSEFYGKAVCETCHNQYTKNGAFAERRSQCRGRQPQTRGHGDVTGVIVQTQIQKVMTRETGDDVAEVVNTCAYTQTQTQTQTQTVLRGMFVTREVPKKCACMMMMTQIQTAMI